jgi:hypothetical protein
LAQTQIELIIRLTPSCSGEKFVVVDHKKTAVNLSFEQLKKKLAMFGMSDKIVTIIDSKIREQLPENCARSKLKTRTVVAPISFGNINFTLKATFENGKLLYQIWLPDGTPSTLTI